MKPVMKTVEEIRLDTGGGRELRLLRSDHGGGRILLSSTWASAPMLPIAPQCVTVNLELVPQLIAALDALTSAGAE